MKPIAINGRFLSQPVTGVQRHARELMQALDGMLARGELERPEHGVEVLMPPGFKAPRLEFIQAKAVGRACGQEWEQLSLPGYCRGKLLFTPCGGAPLLHGEHVFTVPDAGVFATPGSYTRAYGSWYRWHHRQAAKKDGMRLLTVSQFSKNELQRWLGMDGWRITVTPLGHEHVLAQAADERALRRMGVTPKEYVLAVGSANPNKNFRGLTEAFRRVRERMGGERARKLRLVIAGQGNSRIFGGERSVVEGVIHSGRVTDAELRALYENAACLALPSFYEGFGLPLLEAMALGCPAVSSNRASLPEVGGDAAVYFNPEDSEEMAGAMTRVLLDAELRTELAQRGMRRALRFRWRETARLTWAALMEASGGNRVRHAA